MSTFEPAPPQRVHLSLPLTRPVLVWGLLGFNFLVFVIETLLGGSENSATLVKLGAKVNVLIAMGEYWRLVTPMFLHIGVIHILVNSYALYVLGPEVEALFGRARFLSIYLLSGIAGNVMSYAFTPNLSAGASTAIFGLVGAEMVFFYRQRETLGAFGQRRLLNILSIIAINLFIGVSSGAVDNFGHAGGFIGGVVLGWLLCPDYQVEYGLDGQPRVQDRNSLLHELPGVVLFIALLMAATAAVTLREAKRPQVKLEQGVQACFMLSANPASTLRAPIARWHCDRVATRSASDEKLPRWPGQHQSDWHSRSAHPGGPYSLTVNCFHSPATSHRATRFARAAMSLSRR